MNKLTPGSRSTSGSFLLYIIAAVTALVMIGLPVSERAAKHLASPDLWFDESGQFFLSLGLHHFTAPGAPKAGWGNILEYGRPMNSDPGAFTALLRGWIDAFGPSPRALRSLPFLFFLLTPVVIVLSALRCGANPVAAALAGSIPLGFPMLLNYATEVRAYSMETFAVVFLFFLSFWLQDEFRNWMVVTLGCVASLLVVSRYSAFLFGAAACLTALLPLHPLRTAVLRASRFAIPVIIAVAAGYLLFAQYQFGGTHRPPAYVETLVLSGKDTATQFAILRENFFSSEGLPIAFYVIAAPLFFWLGPRSLTRLRSLVGRTAVFSILSVTFTVAASLAGRLPWAIHSRWAVGYQALSACCGAMIIIVAGTCLDKWAADWPKRILLIGTAACFTLLWSMQVKRAIRSERPYYETIGSHLQVLANLPNAKDLRFFVNFNSSPTTRYLCEFGPFKGAFSYPARFHFEPGEEASKATPISANEYDVIVLTHFSFADAYRARVADGKAELKASPQPSCLLMLKR